MRVLILGAAGFIGTHLTSALIARGRLTSRAGDAEPIDELVLADVRTPAAPPNAPFPVRIETGDCADAAFLEHLFAGGIDSVFPLAAALTTEAEANFDRGLEINVLAFLRLLEICRRRARAPRLV